MNVVEVGLRNDGWTVWNMKWVIKEWELRWRLSEEHVLYRSYTTDNKDRKRHKIQLSFHNEYCILNYTSFMNAIVYRLTKLCNHWCQTQWLLVVDRSRDTSVGWTSQDASYATSFGNISCCVVLMSYKGTNEQTVKIILLICVKSHIYINIAQSIVWRLGR